MYPLNVLLDRSGRGERLVAMLALKQLELVVNRPDVSLQIARRGKLFVAGLTFEFEVFMHTPDVKIEADFLFEAL